MATPDTPGMWLANLHDAYMTANLMKAYMLREPVVSGAEALMTSARGRLERAWYRDLFVTLEAWRAGSDEQTEPVRRRAEAEVAELEVLIAEGLRDGKVDRLREVRDYICHRDRREYWDAGRDAVAAPGMLEWAMSVDLAFERITLTVLRSVHG